MNKLGKSSTTKFDCPLGTSWHPISNCRPVPVDVSSSGPDRGDSPTRKWQVRGAVVHREHDVASARIAGGGIEWPA